MTVDSRSAHQRHQNEPIISKPKLYYQLVKPGIVYSNVMTGAAGYLLASKWHVHLWKLLALVIGMGLLIAAACVFNNYIDTGLDEKMERTKKRATVSGEIKTRHVLSYGAILLVLGFIVLLPTNKLVMLIGALAVLFYVVIYGVAKRASVYGTLVGTLPGGASLVAGYCAYTGKFGLAAFLLLLIMVFWQMPHFYAIAIFRMRDYRAAGLPLWPIKRGIPSTVRQMRLYIMGYILTAFFFSVLGYAGYSFLIVIVVVAGYWLNLAYKTPEVSSEEAWARRVFKCSLVVLLVMSVMLPVSKLIP